MLITLMQNKSGLFHNDLRQHYQTDIRTFKKICEQVCISTTSNKSLKNSALDITKGFL